MSDKITNIKSLRLNKVDKILIIEKRLFKSSAQILDKTAQYLDSGVNLIEFFPDNIKDIENLEIAQKLRQLSSIYDSLFVIKNRLDIVQITDADGIIIDINSINIAYIKKYLKNNKFIGFDSSLLLADEVENYILKQVNYFDFIQGKINLKQLNNVKIFNNSIIERLK